MILFTAEAGTPATIRVQALALALAQVLEDTDRIADSRIRSSNVISRSVSRDGADLLMHLRQDPRNSGMITAEVLKATAGQRNPIWIT